MRATSTRVGKFGAGLMLCTSLAAAPSALCSCFFLISRIQAGGGPSGGGPPSAPAPRPRPSPRTHSCSPPTSSSPSGVANRRFVPCRPCLALLIPFPRPSWPIDWRPASLLPRPGFAFEINGPWAAALSFPASYRAYIPAPRSDLVCHTFLLLPVVPSFRPRPYSLAVVCLPVPSGVVGLGREKNEWVDAGAKSEVSHLGDGFLCCFSEVWGYGQRCGGGTPRRHGRGATASARADRTSR